MQISRLFFFLFFVIIKHVDSFNGLSFSRILASPTFHRPNPRIFTINRNRIALQPNKYFCPSSSLFFSLEPRDPKQTFNGDLSHSLEAQRNNLLQKFQDRNNSSFIDSLSHLIRPQDWKLNHFSSSSTSHRVLRGDPIFEWAMDLAFSIFFPVKRKALKTDPRRLKWIRIQNIGVIIIGAILYGLTLWAFRSGIFEKQDIEKYKKEILREKEYQEVNKKNFSFFLFLFLI